MEQVNGWSDALRDHSEKISYLNELEASIDKIDSGKIKNIQNLKNAVSELRNNYEERIKLQVFDTCFAVIEQGNSWNEVLTGEKRPLTGWDFKENTKYNMSKVVADVIKDLGEGSLPLLKGLSKAITTIRLSTEDRKQLIRLHKRRCFILISQNCYASHKFKSI